MTPLVFAPLVRPSGAKADGSALLDAGIAMWMRRAAGARTVAFCANVAASRELAARLCDADVPAVHMDGTTPADERRRVLSPTPASAHLRLHLPLHLRLRQRSRQHLRPSPGLSRPSP